MAESVPIDQPSLAMLVVRIILRGSTGNKAVQVSYLPNIIYDPCELASSLSRLDLLVLQAYLGEKPGTEVTRLLTNLSL